MKVLETKSGQVFEIWESRKEALHDVADIIDGIRYANKIGQRTDDLLWVEPAQKTISFKRGRL